MRLLVVLLILTSACSSELKRAQKLLQNDAAEEAEASFEKLVEKDPHNADAAIGLERARAKVVDRGLIDVRMLRLAENPGPALERLNGLLEREKNWNLRLDAKIASSQRDEVGYASYFLDQQIQQALNGQKALLAQDLTLRYPGLTAADERAPWLTPKRRAQINASGQQNCASYIADYRRAPGNPNYADFVLRYCRFFSPQIMPVAMEKDLAHNNAYLYRDLSIQWKNAEGLDSGRKNLVEQNLRTAFRQSPWYAATASGNLAVSLDARLYEYREHEPTHRTHYYTETEYFDVKRPIDREVVTETTVYRDNQPVVERKTQSFKESITVTESREVSRSVNYRGFANQETLDLGLRAQFVLATGPLGFDFSRHLHREGEEHDFEMVEAGLKRLSWTPTVTHEWLSESGAEAVTELDRDLTHRWRSDFCGTDDFHGQKNSQVWESLWKCLRGNHAPAPAFADAWFEKQLGVDVASAVKYLGTPDGT